MLLLSDTYGFDIENAGLIYLEIGQHVQRCRGPYLPSSGSLNL